jgi:hypothetical protein
MMWWFLILAFGAGAALWAGIAMYLRVRGHMNAQAASKDSSGEGNHEP